MGEHLPYKQRVSGSSPLTSTNIDQLEIVDLFFEFSKKYVNRILWT